MAKASGDGPVTIYLAEGQPVPDLPGVRFVGPGAPSELSGVESPSPASEATSEGEGEQPSASSSSSASGGRTRSSGRRSSAGRRKPAQRTGRRSSQGQVESSTVPSTATSGPETDASDN